ncbi:glycosyltransferase family 61 protein [Paenibacillus hemerocallicola]|uniref:Glycosyltransferase family 61 protein n=1 Tax=Paenibacillus hemerocallicola TaxID=1172614 RepID=A0A5C4T355_9BACL|nr:glycosyltransferase family 61 protein [Paenibacillus hemerocallicola]TNJ62589.1 glycosyltransferase family 61 protein [Paenibacillus hemerocallicola]
MIEATPAGTYTTLRDWIVASESARLECHHLHKIIHQTQPYHLVSPGTVDDELHPVFQQRRVTTPDGYVAVLPEGRYFGGEEHSGAIITPDNKLVWDVSMNFYIPGWVHPIFKRKSLPTATRTSETVAVLTFIWSRNYFHWMIDVLGRIDLIRKSGLSVDKYIISNDGPSKIQEETLGLLGIPKEKIIRSYDGLHLRAARLIVPSLQVISLLPFSCNPMPRWATNFVRSELFKIVKPSPYGGHERIYISRREAKHRRVLNESEVLHVMATYGFREVKLEEMTVADQVRLFHSANMVVAPHGASLTNIMFCRTGTQVVDIFPPEYMYPCFWHISSYYGLRYSYLIGKGKRLSKDENIGLVGHVYTDLTVDIGALTAMLRRMVS